MTAIVAVVLSFIAMLDGGAQPAVGAERINNATEVTSTDPPPVEETLCGQAYRLRAEAGLPYRFDHLIWRESNCRNDVTSSTGCCVGLLQLNRVIWNDHRMVNRLADCGATWWNVRGTSEASKRRNVCAAKALFDVAGYSPWSM